MESDEAAPWTSGTLRNEVRQVVVQQGVTTIGENAFRDCFYLISVKLPASGLTEIGFGAFCNCANLTAINIPNGVQAIGDMAFYYCRTLTSVTVPGSVKTVGNNAFAVCSGLTDITFEEGVQYLSWSVMDGCTALRTLRLPRSLTYIGDCATYGAPIENVYYGGSQADWNKISIGDENYGLYNAVIHYNTALGVPTMTVKLNGDGKPVVSWTRVAGAAQYEVYRSLTGKANSYSIVRRTAGLTFTDTAAAAGKTYYYVVRAINGGTIGKFCASKSIKCTAALGVPTMTLKLGSNSKPVISWTKVTGAAQYEVYRSLTGKANSYSIVRRTAGLIFTDTSTAEGKTYYYVVRAINGGATGKFCASRSVTVPGVLGVPAMTLKLSGDSKPVVSWTKVTGAAQYEVYRSLTGKANSYSIFCRTTGLTFVDTNVSAGNTYYYVVRAVNSSTTGKFCAAKSVAIQAVLGAPTMTLECIEATGKPIIDWKAVSGAAQYEVYRSTTGASSSYSIVRRTAGLSFTDAQAVTGMRYYYVVRAINGNAKGSFCAAQSIVCTLGMPQVIVRQNAVGGVVPAPEFSWNAVEGATSYEIYRALSAKGPYHFLDETTRTIYRVSEASGSACYYMFIAKNGGLLGLESRSVRVMAWG